MITNRTYNQKDQYKNSTNLRARADLHIRFKTNPYEWLQWVFDQFDLQPSMQILELGCGTGALWSQNLNRLANELQIYLTDISYGMTQEVKQILAAGAGFTFTNLDATYISMASHIFDIVIANHMLYHVPDLPQTVREISRVLKPTGRLYATTMGPKNFRELHELLHEFEPRYFLREPAFEIFGLQNAAEILSQNFDRVEIRRYEDALVVTEVKPLVDYVFSGWDYLEILDHQAKELDVFFKRKLKKNGNIRITKDFGVVIADPKTIY